MIIENHTSIFQEFSQKLEEEKLDGSFLTNYARYNISTFPYLGKTPQTGPYTVYFYWTSTVCDGGGGVRHCILLKNPKI